MRCVSYNHVVLALNKLLDHGVQAGGYDSRPVSWKARSLAMCYSSREAHSRMLLLRVYQRVVVHVLLNTRAFLCHFGLPLRALHSGEDGRTALCM